MMLGWMEKCRKQTALALNIPAIIATTAFAIVQNHDASSLAGMAGMRVAALISVALPHIARLKKAKSHSPLHRKSKQEGAAEFKTTPFRATHVRSMVAPAIARTHR